MKLYYFLVIAVILTVSSSMLGVGVQIFGHTADQVRIVVQGEERILQDAISLNLHSAPANQGCGVNQCYNGANDDGSAICVPIQSFTPVGGEAEPINFDGPTPQIYRFTGNEIVGEQILEPGTEYNPGDNTHTDGSSSLSGTITYTVTATAGIGSCSYSYQDAFCTQPSTTIYTGSAVGDGPYFDTCLAQVKSAVQNYCANAYDGAPVFRFGTADASGNVPGSTFTNTVPTTIIYEGSGEEQEVTLDELGGIDTNSDGQADVVDVNKDNYYDVWDLDFDWDGDPATADPYEGTFVEAYSDFNYREENKDQGLFGNIQYVLLTSFDNPVKIDSNGDGMVDAFDLGLGQGANDLKGIIWDLDNINESRGVLRPSSNSEYALTSVNVLIDANNGPIPFDEFMLQYVYVDSGVTTTPITPPPNAEADETIASVPTSQTSGTWTYVGNEDITQNWFYSHSGRVYSNANNAFYDLTDKWVFLDGTVATSDNSFLFQHTNGWSYKDHLWVYVRYMEVQDTSGSTETIISDTWINLLDSWDWDLIGESDVPPPPPPPTPPETVEPEP